MCNYVMDWILGHALHYFPGVQVGINVHVPSLTYANDMVLQSSDYMKTQNLFEVANRHAVAVGMHINVARVRSALIPNEQHRAVVPDGSILLAHDQGTVEIRNMLNITRSARSHLQSYIWSCQDISLCTKSTAYHAVVCFIPLYGCGMRPVQTANERVMAAFANNGILCNLHVRDKYVVPTVELQ